MVCLKTTFRYFWFYSLNFFEIELKKKIFNSNPFLKFLPHRYRSIGTLEIEKSKFLFNKRRSENNLRFANVWRTKIQIKVHHAFNHWVYHCGGFIQSNLRSPLQLCYNFVHIIIQLKIRTLYKHPCPVKRGASPQRNFVFIRFGKFTSRQHLYYSHSSSNQ